MDLMLRGKTALIMSSSKGIGKGIALSLALEGCNLILTSSNQLRAFCANPIKILN